MKISKVASYIAVVGLKTIGKFPTEPIVSVVVDHPFFLNRKMNKMAM